MEDLKDAGCQFCGNKAATADSLPRIVFQVLESGSESLPYSEQTKLIREVIEQIDAHMRRWVIQRDN
ncbi:MAG: hypothetical protein EOP83_15565 [Verrucomicrobiaceae bacterium]|nr:MAG: hypothetical protein EOP83_15565 [Verrucomicrobiaceae bacterium]